MTLFTVSNKTWLNVEGTLNWPNAASRAQGWRRVGRHNSTGNRLAQENDWHVRGSHTQTSRGTRRIAKWPTNSPLARSNHGAGYYIVIVSDRTTSLDEKPDPAGQLLPARTARTEHRGVRQVLQQLSIPREPGQPDAAARPFSNGGKRSNEKPSSKDAVCISRQSQP